ncbi:unnamed protein product [Menidia menidia]|uniref:(Atlantic silverside) hypothetical protein n=1 Tax=Menidia menidia TaxID=238744 RepID=A0A8S4B8L2_9TELE|nr:unnamed protein product [Menidia menidia]
MQEIEMDNIYEEPEYRGKIKEDANQAEMRVCRLLFLSFGILCIIQASLNLALRLTSYSNQNTAQYSDEGLTLNELQDMKNALTRDRKTLENRIMELLNKVETLKEERAKLEISLSDMHSCKSPKQCPPAWKLINSKCYLLSTESKTWMDSRKDCQSKGADLVIINSEQEQTAIYRLDGNERLLVWIGLHGTNGSFIWVDGLTPKTQFWQRGQPDGGGPNNTQACVEMYHKYPVSSSWNDASCELKRRWLCEKDLCP